MPVRLGPGAVPHSGDNSAVAPPVPIPNTAVKRCSPDGSTAIGRARVGRRQNKTPLSSSQRGFAFLTKLFAELFPFPLFRLDRC